MEVLVPGREYCCNEAREHGCSLSHIVGVKVQGLMLLCTEIAVSAEVFFLFIYFTQLMVAC